MRVRQPHVAGAFYPGSQEQCEDLIDRCLPSGSVLGEGEHRILSAVVPHAGWVYSGETAGQVFAAIREVGGADVFLLFGAVHVWGVDEPSVWSRGAWKTPLGEARVDEELIQILFDELGNKIVDSPASHQQEHSLEVQVPFIQRLFPEATLIPVMVPPTERSAWLGHEMARIIASRCPDRRVIALGSSDLTHYGPNYGFVPAGHGEAGLKWVKEENDKRMIDLAVAMDDGAIVAEAQKSQNACGPGAVAAACGYARELGASKGRLLQYTTSFDVMPERRPTSFVGYAGIVYEA